MELLFFLSYCYQHQPQNYFDDSGGYVSHSAANLPLSCTPIEGFQDSSNWNIFPTFWMFTVYCYYAVYTA